jgi:hypothetical protein
MFDLLMISSSSIFFFSVSLFPSFFQVIAQRSPLPFCFQHIHRQVSPPFGGFCFPYDNPIARGTPRTFNVQPFSRACGILWLRLTSDKQALYRYRLLLLRAALLPPSTIYQISPGKNANFLSIYLSDLQPHVSDSFGLRFVMQTHPHATA